VYDLVKIVDADNCIGVMHLGRFPKGLEFATFVMARNNYPFQKMAIPDHDTIFHGDRVRVPTAAELTGSWKGYIVLLHRPDLGLHNQFNPPLLRLQFSTGTAVTKARMNLGPIPSEKQVQFDADRIRLTDSSSFTEEIRQIDADTLIGQRIRNARPDAPVIRYVLARAR
jgi:hypothetical protein